MLGEILAIVVVAKSLSRIRTDFLNKERRRIKEIEEALKTLKTQKMTYQREIGIQEILTVRVERKIIVKRSMIEIVIKTIDVREIIKKKMTEETKKHMIEIKEVHLKIMMIIQEIKLEIEIHLEINKENVINTQKVML